jgi:hypothetical protein
MVMASHSVSDDVVQTLYGEIGHNDSSLGVRFHILFDDFVLQITAEEDLFELVKVGETELLHQDDIIIPILWTLLVLRESKPPELFRALLNLITVKIHEAFEH